ncbi:MAG: PilZ domain-containing protein [Deltaproteobacteria bacterium]|nr:MAG: PilZ domain-containing protein [Deltaproteobacteria bacterium]
MTDESKRRYPRLEFGIRVFEEKDWMIRDLNPLGCFIETSTPRPVNSELDLHFQIPLESEYVPIVAKGIVRRIGAEGMAIEFTELEPDYYRYIEEFVATYY